MLFGGSKILLLRRSWVGVEIAKNGPGKWGVGQEEVGSGGGAIVVG